MKEKKKEKAILYEAWLKNKYPNYNQEEEIDYIKLCFTITKNILTFFFYLFDFLMVGVGVTVLMNESTRRAFLLLLSDIKF